MLKINKKVEYALISLKFISSKNSNDLTSAREICDHYKTPFDTTAKVLQIMNNGNILNSTKGIKGGYSLSRDLNEVSYMYLAQLIEGKDATQNFCQSNKGICDLYSVCNIVTPIEQLSNKLNQFLEDLSLADLLNTPGTIKEIEKKTELSNEKVI